MSVHLRMAYLVFMRSRRPDGGGGDAGEAFSEGVAEPQGVETEPTTTAALTKVES